MDRGGLIGIGDPAAPVTILDPENPVFSFPNKIGPATWANWIDERGLHFMTERDPQYKDLISITESAKFNPGPQTGALVEARIGRGRWFYIGLGLFRQMPLGVDGSYQMMANLLSVGKAPAQAARKRPVPEDSVAVK